MAPSHFLRLQAFDFVTRRDRRVGIRIGGKLPTAGQRLRRQGGGLRGGRERCRSGRKSKGEFQKVPTLHDDLLPCNAMM
jgi:hypothetical protein